MNIIQFLAHHIFIPDFLWMISFLPKLEFLIFFMS